MATFRTPVVHGVANPFVGEDFGQAIGRGAILPGAGAGDEVDVTGVVLLEIPAVGEVGEVIDGIVEVEIVVVHPVHEIPEIVDTGHGKATLKDIRMLEEGVGGVIRAERCAHSGNGDLRLAVIPDEGNDLFAEVRIENGLDVAAVKRVSAFVIKAEAVDGVEGIKLDAAGVDEIGEGANHALALEFPLVASTCGKTEERGAPMAVGDDAEIQAEPRRVPAMVFTFHQKDLSLCGKEVWQRKER